MEYEIKDYGYRSPTLASDNYFSGVLPKDILNPKGDWRDSTPVYEPQFGAGFDTNDCTIFGLENEVQIYLKGVFNVDWNGSERFISNGMNRDNSVGQDPQLPHEWVRKNGILNQDKLPMVFNMKDYQTPRPIPQDLLDEAKKWGWDLKHEYVFANNPSKDLRLVLLREHLKYSPLGVSVTAWRKQGNLYVDDGRPNTHWAVLVYIDDDGVMYVYDSYDLIVNGVSTALIKKLSPDHHIEVCKRLYITKVEPTISDLTPAQKKGFLAQLADLVRLILGIQKQVNELPKPIPAPVDAPMPPVVAPDPVVPKRDLLKEFCNAIANFEGGPGDPNHINKNPGNCVYSKVGYKPKYGIVKKNGRFAVFETWDIGMLYLENIVREQIDLHPEWTFYDYFALFHAPAVDKNDPKHYAEVVAGDLKIPPTTKITELLA